MSETDNSQTTKAYELVLPAINFKPGWKSNFLLTNIEGEKLGLNINEYEMASTVPVSSSQKLIIASAD